VPSATIPIEEPKFYVLSLSVNPKVKLTLSVTEEEAVNELLKICVLVSGLIYCHPASLPVLVKTAKIFLSPPI